MKFESGDYVMGRAQINKNVMVKGVVIKDINGWSALVSHLDERKRPQFRIIFYPHPINQDPPEVLIKKAKENPYWGKGQEEKVKQETNV